MRTKLTVATALAGTLLATCLVSGSAQATSVPVLKGDATPGIVTLVGRGNGGHGGHGGGMKSSGMKSSGMKGYNKGYALKDHGNKSSAFKDRGSRGNYALKDRDYKKGDGFKDGRKKQYASKDRDHDHGKFKRHRVLRNGVWVWVYGPGYYAYNDCEWLRRQAIITGSPYWWRRYNLCIGYDYY